MPHIIKRIRSWFTVLLIMAASTLTAQNKPVTIKAENVPLSTVLAQIEEQTGYLFVYDESDMDVNRKVSVNSVDVPTRKVLSEIFPKATSVNWILKGRNISLTSRKKTEVTPVSAPKKRVISGTVTDSKDGEPLVGAVVKIQGNDASATIVDVDGNFNINVDESVDKKPVLVVSYIGYNNREVPVTGLNHVDVNMSGASNTLDEVIVVGSGTQKKVSVTGSISTVSGKDLKMPSSTLSRALGGKIAGLITKQTSGEPGTGADFYIRGISTFGGKAEPLILLDDVEITTSDIDFIPAENIESFTVLKDASATAIYGARGANGVMIITTKGGEYNSKTKINVNVENSFNFISSFPEFVNGAEFMRLYNKAQYDRNPVLPQYYSDLAIERTESGVNRYLYPDTDWRRELLRDMAMRQRANLNVSGGGTKAKYYMSIDFQHENGLQKADNFYSWNNNQQIYNYTFQNNISYKLTPSTNVSLNINSQIRQKTGPSTASESLFSWIGMNNPVDFPAYYPVGARGEVRYGSKRVSSGYLTNPKREMNRAFSQNNIYTVNSVLKLDQNLDMITKGLKLNAWVNYRSRSSQQFTRAIDPYIYWMPVSDDIDVNAPVEPILQNPSASQFIDESSVSKSIHTTFELSANINWSRKFDLHDISAMVLYRMREYRNGVRVLPNRNQGISGRVTYDYGHRYLAEFNFGYNGSERLTKGHRFGFFPAASLGWVVSNERFWEPLGNVVTHLKLRGSYGLVGSDDLDSPNNTYYLFMDQIYSNNLNFWGFTTGDGESSYTGKGPLVRYFALNDVVWEKSKKLDLGFDLTLWGDLNVTAEYFREDRYDIFMQRGSWPWALGYGLAIPWANTGKVLNQGVEVSVNYTHALNNETSISFQGNLTYTKNKFIDKDEPQYKYKWQYVTGCPLDQYRIDGYIAEGLFQSQEEIANSPEQQVGASVVMVGDVKYRDLNGDGKINADDKTMISKYGQMPRLMYGFGATLNWRKWDFGFFFTGTGCRRINIANKMDPFQSIGLADRNVFRWVADNYFDPEKGNFDAQYPRLGLKSGDIANNQVNSTYWLRDASYLRLRNLELGYSFKYGRVYVNGVDLLCFSSFKLWDPELDGPYKYPLQKTVNVGVQFNL